jgi:hypothetical protein
LGLTPVFARGAARSREELYGHIRQATEPILAVAIPAALFVSVGADLWLRLLFGHAFASATLALRTLSASSVIIYLAIVYAMTLIMLARAWTLARFQSRVGRQPPAQSVAHPPLDGLFAEGGGGGGSLAALGTHVFAAAAMIAFAGRGLRSAHAQWWRRPTACVLVVVDRLTASLTA